MGFKYCKSFEERAFAYGILVEGQVFFFRAMSWQIKETVCNLQVQVQLYAFMHDRICKYLILCIQIDIRVQRDICIYASVYM